MEFQEIISRINICDSIEIDNSLSANEKIAIIEAIRPNQFLKELALDLDFTNSVDMIGLLAKILQKKPVLNKLIIRAKYVFSDTLKNLCQLLLPNETLLITLDLSDVELTVGNIEVLFDFLKECNFLESLIINLRELNFISAQPLVRAAAGNKQLKKLDLGNVYNISLDETKKLAAILENSSCFIYFNSRKLERVQIENFLQLNQVKKKEKTESNVRYQCIYPLFFHRQISSKLNASLNFALGRLKIKEIYESAVTLHHCILKVFQKTLQDIEIHYPNCILSMTSFYAAGLGNLLLSIFVDPSKRLGQGIIVASCFSKFIKQDWTNIHCPIFSLQREFFKPLSLFELFFKDDLHIYITKGNNEILNLDKIKEEVFDIIFSKLKESKIFEMIIYFIEQHFDQISQQIEFKSKIIDLIMQQESILDQKKHISSNCEIFLSIFNILSNSFKKLSILNDDADLFLGDLSVPRFSVFDLYEKKSLLLEVMPKEINDDCLKSIIHEELKEIRFKFTAIDTELAGGCYIFNSEDRLNYYMNIITEFKILLTLKIKLVNFLEIYLVKLISKESISRSTLASNFIQKLSDHFDTIENFLVYYGAQIENCYHCYEDEREKLNYLNQENLINMDLSASESGSEMDEDVENENQVPPHLLV